MTAGKPYILASRLATRYLMERWVSRHLVAPPLDLTRSVLAAVGIAGFSIAVVDRVIFGYEKGLLALEVHYVQQ